MTIGDIFAQYGGDIIALVLALLSVVFGFLAQLRIGRVGKSLDSKASNAVAITQMEEAAQQTAPEQEKEENTMKFEKTCTASVTVDVRNGAAATAITVTTADGKTLTGIEAVKVIREFLDVAQGV